MKKSFFTALMLLSGVVSPSSAFAEMTAGVAKKTNESAGKITLKHGPIVNLDMGVMSMVFKAGEPEMLTAVAPAANLREDDMALLTWRCRRGAADVTPRFRLTFVSAPIAF